MGNIGEVTLQPTNMEDQDRKAAAGPGQDLRTRLSQVSSGFGRALPRTSLILAGNKVLVETFLLIILTALVLNLLFGGNLASVLVSGIVVGSIYVLGATGLSLLYGVKKFANFAHGDLLTLGAYMAFFVNVGLGLHIVFGLLFSLVVLALVGIVLEILIFSRLQGKGVVAPLVASLGVAIVIQNSIQAIWGGDILAYRYPRLTNVVTPWFSIHPIKGLLTLGVSITVVVLLHILLSRTVLGKSMRAMSDNLELARSSGISTQNVALWTWVISCLLAALAGVLFGMALDVRPELGLGVLLFLFAAVIVGGIGSPYGAMIGGFAVGIIQEVSGLFLDWIDRPQAVDYRAVGIGFAILLLIASLLGAVLVRRTWHTRRLTHSRGPVTSNRPFAGLRASSVLLAVFAYLILSLGVVVAFMAASQIGQPFLGGAFLGIVLLTPAGFFLGLVLVYFSKTEYGPVALGFLVLQAVLALLAVLFYSLLISGATTVRLDAAPAYRSAAAFIVMIVVLLLKPEGLLGTPIRGASRRAHTRGQARRG